MSLNTNALKTIIKRIVLCRRRVLNVTRYIIINIHDLIVRYPEYPFLSLSWSSHEANALQFDCLFFFLLPVNLKYSLR